MMNVQTKDPAERARRRREYLKQIDRINQQEAIRKRKEARRKKPA